MKQVLGGRLNTLGWVLQERILGRLSSTTEHQKCNGRTSGAFESQPIPALDDIGYLKNNILSEMKKEATTKHAQGYIMTWYIVPKHTWTKA
jgi:hypothetical protein